MSAKKYSPAFLEAEAILGMIPLPDDAAERMEALEKKIWPDERACFGDLWEALIAASDNPDI